MKTKDLIAFTALVKATKGIRRVPVNIWGDLSFNVEITAFQLEATVIQTPQMKEWGLAWEEVK